MSGVVCRSFAVGRRSSLSRFMQPAMAFHFEGHSCSSCEYCAIRPFPAISRLCGYPVTRPQLHYCLDNLRSCKLATQHLFFATAHLLCHFLSALIATLQAYLTP
ncbi:hypothetical protein BS50DRAFT_340900 [Corynespora cassiicola Philippines]|uniref:Uncharacterized protein n=1 Tax=Corynespora cassiicola Philippines TaxID=1448308 RepID=A0A2T2NWA0_CORCC|nr:hypothetical protein BS50DRAFT_340900 [Corynespora cassiicola Philippines]